MNSGSRCRRLNAVCFLIALRAGLPLDLGQSVAARVTLAIFAAEPLLLKQVVLWSAPTNVQCVVLA